MSNNPATDVEGIEGIREFMLRASSSARPKKMRAFTFTLFHKSETVGTSPQGQEFFGEKVSDLESLSDAQREEMAAQMAKNFYRTAKTLTSVERRPQVFSISGYYSTDPAAFPVDSHTLRVDPDLSTLSEYTEEPTARGQASQAMRGMELSSKELTRRTSDFFQAIDRNQARFLEFIDLIGRRNQHLEDNQAALAEKYQAALDNSMARITDANIKILEANRTERHYGMVEEVAAQLVPVVVAALKEKAGRGPLISLIKRMKPDNLKMVWEMVKVEGTEEDKKAFAEVLSVAGLLPEAPPVKVPVGRIEFEETPKRPNGQTPAKETPQ